MVVREIYEKFAKESPVAVMVRVALEFALPASFLDELFVEHAERLGPVIGQMKGSCKPLLSDEVRCVCERMMIVVPACYWTDRFEELTPAAMAK